MNWFVEIVSNPLIVTGFSAWFIAQLLKTVIYAVINKKIDLKRIYGDGGMPSGHSATVTALCAMSSWIYGFYSFEFALTFTFAIIVCHDAMGVRLETGKQAVLIKEIAKTFEILTNKELPEVKLKELVGHTPLQVMAGVILGIVVCVIMCYTLPYEWFQSIA